MYMIERKYSNILYGSSFFILILSMRLFAMGYPRMSEMYFLLFLTSINHWKNPGYNLKRLVDISAVVVSTLIGGFYMYYLGRHHTYAIITLYTLCLFGLSGYFHKINYMYTSTFLHSKIHLVCLLGNMYLYGSL